MYADVNKNNCSLQYNKYPLKRHVLLIECQTRTINWIRVHLYLTYFKLVLFLFFRTLLIIYEAFKKSVKNKILLMYEHLKWNLYN